MYCSNCGKEIDNKAVVCVYCGVGTQNLNKEKEHQNVIINNVSNSTTKHKKKYSLLLDLILIFCTAGLWIIWMIVRPKYEY